MKALQLVLAVVLVSTQAFATSKDVPASAEGVVVTHATGSSVFKVYYKALAANDVKVYVFDSNGRQIFSETLKKITAFVRPYNLTGLSAGTYKVVVKDRQNSVEEEFYYSAGKVTKHINILKMTEPGKYLLSVQSETADKVNLNIYDKEQRLVHSQVYDVNKAFAEVLNLKNINEFTIEVSDRDGVLKTVKGN
ncbi:MAG: hypothetical protein KF775_01935 [Cyclobacteriaceae bacterium]|nr:hypothetical protein [Cyclobacteriaceae bacterium]